MQLINMVKRQKTLQDKQDVILPDEKQLDIIARYMMCIETSRRRGTFSN